MPDTVIKYGSYIILPIKNVDGSNQQKKKSTLKMYYFTKNKMVRKKFRMHKILIIFIFYMC